MRSMFTALALVVVATPAWSQTMIPGTITMIRTGWNADSFAVVTAEPIANPAHCPTPDGYISERSLPGYNTYYAAALTAYATNSKVIVTVHNTQCGPAGRPKLIGINLTR
jgi:hypothetical protein